MSGVLQTAALAVVCALLALTLKGELPALGWCVALAGVVVVLSRGVTSFGAELNGLRELLAASGLDSGLYLPVLRVVGIAVIVRIAGALCRDAGQAALAVGLELIGTAAAAVACLPLFRQVLALAGGVL